MRWVDFHFFFSDVPWGPKNERFRSLKTSISDNGWILIGLSTCWLFTYLRVCNSENSTLEKQEAPHENKCKLQHKEPGSLAMAAVGRCLWTNRHRVLTVRVPKSPLCGSTSWHPLNLKWQFYMDYPCKNKIKIGADFF